MSDHYFSDRPGTSNRRHSVRFSAWGHDLELATADGVFAKDGLDKATDVLLRHVPPPSPGATVLDLGCGWGPIACAMAVASPESTVWAVDINERAVELTRENAARLGITVNAVLPGDVPDGLRFDGIWSNPPIRIGKAALHALLQEWLPRLEADGRGHLVVGKNLGADSLQRWLVEQGRPTSRVASEQGFRVLQVERG